MKKIIPILVIISFVILSIGASGIQLSNSIVSKQLYLTEDLDPLVDINLFFEINAIRALDEIDIDSDPDFYIKLYINGNEFLSPVWEDQLYLYDCWSVVKDIDDENEFVDIIIELWDQEDNGDRLCDLSPDTNYNQEGYDIKIQYNIKTGHWTNQDYLGDESGYGRLNGCDDGSIYENEYDCEMWFDIYQTDFDNDGLPYYVEKFVYQTDPETNNTGDDDDEDGIPIEWEHHWGYDPFIFDEYEELDLDFDSINNTEEYLTSNFKSDPFRKDIFLEMDFMEDLTGNNSYVPEETFEIIQKPFNRRNIVFHTDYGQIEGGDIIPFDEKTNRDELIDIHRDFFLNNDNGNWRRGVFHYGIIVNKSQPNMAFSGDTKPLWGYHGGTNSFVITKSLAENRYEKINHEKSLAYLCAALYMHELGHNFGIRFGKPLGCDNPFSNDWYLPQYYIYRNYKSIMNYRYLWDILDYSNGTHGIRDYDDWSNIDLSYFERSSKSNIYSLNLN